MTQPLLRQEDIKVGDRLRYRTGRKMLIVVTMIHEAGFVCGFGMIPWSNLHMFERAEK